MSGGGGGQGAPFPIPPPFGSGSSDKLPKKAPSLTDPLSKGVLFEIAHRLPFSAIIDQKSLKHLWWTKFLVTAIKTKSNSQHLKPLCHTLQAHYKQTNDEAIHCITRTGLLLGCLPARQ